MTCEKNYPYYIPQNQYGLKLVNSVGNGYDIEIYWYEAFPSSISYKIGYNIYFSSEKENIFTEGPKFISTNLNGLNAKINNFSPGDIYYFCVRATQYQLDWYNINFLPEGDGYQIKIYPETLLLNNILNSSININVSDINLFPPYGIININSEYIKYDSIDIPNSLLLISERGFLNTKISSHFTDGYYYNLIDGYVQGSPIIRFFPGLEEKNSFISQEESRFNYPNFPYSLTDGYMKVIEDLLTTDLTSDAEQQIIFPSYPFNDWVRGDLEILFKGGCLDSYIGQISGGCSDGYGGVGTQIRNNSISDINDQRQELLLNYTGEPVVLVNRLWKGIRCSCYESNKENPENRCPKCFGTSFITGYQQFYNPRDSSGRILVRFGPYNDDLRQDEAGLESIAEHDCWTLSPYLLKDRDFIIRFNIDGTEEFRYEITGVTRNKLLFGVSGNQHFKATRIRKTDPIYSWKAILSTATMPHFVNTTVGLLIGPNKVPQPHTHTVNLNENIISLSQINQTTSVSLGHNHTVIEGIIQPSPIDGHIHSILF